MNAAIEFHDSMLLSVSSVGEGVLIRLKAYVHRCSPVEGSPGTGWSQEVAITFATGAVEVSPTHMPVWISDGQLGKFINLVPLPLTLTEEASLSLETCAGESLVVRGRDLQVDPLGEATFVEEVPFDFG